MKVSIRRQIRILQVYAAASFAVLAFIAFSAFAQSPAQRSEELTVQRLNALPEGPQRDEAVKAVRAKAPAGPRRVFVGKNADKAATVSLADSNGKPRLVMTVGADGAASIDFLDADGKTVRRIPASK